jgi:hypothetical protein
MQISSFTSFAFKNLIMSSSKTNVMLSLAMPYLYDLASCIRHETTLQVIIVITYPLVGNHIYNVVMLLHIIDGSIQFTQITKTKINMCSMQMMLGPIACLLINYNKWKWCGLLKICRFCNCLGYYKDVCNV